MAQAYEAQASDLKGLSVPALLAQSHIRLVNVNLLNGAAFDATTKMNADPAVGLAGIIAVSQNAEAEAAIITQMLAILQGNQ